MHFFIHSQIEILPKFVNPDSQQVHYKHHDEPKTQQQHKSVPRRPAFDAGKPIVMDADRKMQNESFDFDDIFDPALRPKGVDTTWMSEYNVNKGSFMIINTLRLCSTKKKYFKCFNDWKLLLKPEIWFFRLVLFQNQFSVPKFIERRCGLSRMVNVVLTNLSLLFNFLPIQNNFINKRYMFHILLYI